VTLLDARGLTVARGGRTVLRDVDIALDAGEALAIVGPNGAGKSTLLATLAGLLTPTAGRITTNGRVAYALQGNALADRSAQANVEAALAWWGTRRPDRRSRALAALEQLGASALARRRATTLSGGEARRVHLARALALEPDVLLLDEPFAGLDAPTRAELLQDLGRVIRRPGSACILVVHDRSEAWALADRVLVLIDGRTAAIGPTREVLLKPATREVATFLGFTGEIRDADGSVRRYRPSDVHLDGAGPLSGVVTGRWPTEDGFRIDVRLADGHLTALASLDAPAIGERVSVAVRDGITVGSDESPRLRNSSRAR
jgi:ABC-type sulfate/molybdate transport systems ATPase subunit